MTYRSNTYSPDKTDYSNFGFKKSEILKVLQNLSSDFSFEKAEPIVQKSINLSQENINQNSQYNYKFFLFKKPLLSLHEAACIMTGFDPQHVNRCRNDTNFNINFANYLGAMDYINSCASARLLDYSEQYDEMNTGDFKKFLENENTFIEGFNDYLTPPISTVVQVNNNSNETISDLEFDLVIERGTVNILNAEIEKLKAELLKKDQIIKELRLIQTIVDESKLGSTRAENNVTKLLLVLAEMANININKPHAVHESLLVQADLLGVDKFPSDETIKKWLIKANNHKTL